MEQNSEFWSYKELWIEEEFEEIEDTEDTEEIRENPGPAAFGYTLRKEHLASPEEAYHD